MKCKVDEIITKHRGKFDFVPLIIFFSEWRIKQLCQLSFLGGNEISGDHWGSVRRAVHILNNDTTQMIVIGII